MARRRHKNPQQPHHGQPSEGDHSSLMLGNDMRELVPWNDSHVDREPWHFGNGCNTHAQAKQARDTRTEVLRPLHEAQR